MVGPVHETLLGDDLQVLDGGGGHGGMARVGVAGAQQEAGLLEVLAHPAAHDHAAEGQVAGGHTLGEGHHVGRHAERLGAEPLAGAAESADHLVEDQQGAVLVAEPADPGEVALRRREHPARALHRLGDDRSHPLAVLGERGGHHLDVVVGHLDEVGDQIAPSLAVGSDALGRGAAEVGAVVAVGASYHHLAFDAAGPLGVEAGELECGVHRVRPGAAEEHPPVGQRRAFGDHLGRPGRGRVGERVEGVVGGELAHLRGHRVGHLRAGMADLAVPEAGQAVDVRPPLVVVEGGALGPHDVDHVGLGLGRRGEGMEQSVVTHGTGS